MMSIYNQLLDHPVVASPCVFTFGTFDGVHLGHQFIFEQVKKLASLHGYPTACLTFSNHPAKILSPGKPLCQLTSPEQKLAFIHSFGFDVLVDIPFDERLSRLSAAQFINAVRKMIYFSDIVVGVDVAFGNRREGNSEFLKLLAKQLGFQVHFLERFSVDNTPVSSSLIRSLIAAGDLSQAHRLLGRPYSLVAKPLSSSTYDVRDMALPPCGVWAGAVTVDGQKEKRRALVSIGMDFPLELHLLEPSLAREVKNVEVWFLKFLRPQRHFASTEELQEQMEKDKKLAQSL